MTYKQNPFGIATNHAATNRSLEVCNQVGVTFKNLIYCLLPQRRLSILVKCSVGRAEIIEIKGEGKRAHINLKCNVNPEHGVFKKTPETLYGRDFICPKCAHKAAQNQRTDSIRKTQDEKREERLINWLKKVEEFHKGKFDYTEVEYHDAHSPVLIVCPQHGLFL